MFKKLILFIALFIAVPFVSTPQNAADSTVQKFELSPEIFINFSAEPGEENMTLTWALDHKAYELLKQTDRKLIVSYITKIEKDKIKEGFASTGWEYTDAVDLDANKIEIEGLTGHENYYFKIGVAPDGDVVKLKDDKEKMIWSDSVKAKTERGWGIVKLLILIGSLGFFIYGMKLMSEGLQQVAGNRLRNMMGKITSNRVSGVLTGFGTTAIIQSSSVTTVMTVSFVNAGIMSLRQSAGIMMGANIGTTITAWLVLLLGFKVSISDYAFIIIAFATPLVFMTKGKARSYATTIFGFCILFLGLEALTDAVPKLDEGSMIVQFFVDFKDVWYGPIMFVILGALVTIVIQSSSAAMTLTLAMVSTGTIPFEVACAMVLGENIGTTITAELASLVANVHAKRSARIHSLFNIIGVGWMLIIFPFFLKGLSYLVEGDPYHDTDVANTTIALFHTAFNTVNVLILIWFVPQLVKLAERTVKSRGEADEEFKLDYISGPLGSTPELCILEAKKEVAKFGKITAKMNKFVTNYLNTSDRKIKNKMLGKIEKYEEITDRVEVEIADYLGKTARLEMSSEASVRMRGMLNITTDLERIGDIFFQMAKTLERKDGNKIYFTPEQREGLNEMLKLVTEAFDIMNYNLNSEYGSISLDSAIAKEREINQMRDQLREMLHLEIGAGAHSDNALIFSDMFSSLEKVGDHIINVSEHVAEKNKD